MTESYWDTFQIKTITNKQKKNQKMQRKEKLHSLRKIQRPGGLGSKMKRESKEFKKKQQNMNMNDDRRQWHFNQAFDILMLNFKPTYRILSILSVISKLVFLWKSFTNNSSICLRICQIKQLFRTRILTCGIFAAFQSFLA